MVRGLTAATVSTRASCEAGMRRWSRSAPSVSNTSGRPTNTIATSAREASRRASSSRAASGRSTYRSVPLAVGHRGDSRAEELERGDDAARVDQRAAGALEPRHPGEVAQDGDGEAGGVAERQQAAVVLEQHAACRCDLLGERVVRVHVDLERGARGLGALDELEQAADRGVDVRDVERAVVRGSDDRAWPHRRHLASEGRGRRGELRPGRRWHPSPTSRRRRSPTRRAGRS